MAWSGWLACFGLDRIGGLRSLDESFTSLPDFDAATYYADAFGITWPHDAEPQDVVLCFEPTQGRYALSHPLHASQRVLAHTDDEIRLALRVYLTHELYMELLSYGPAVEVLPPASLRKWVRTGRWRTSPTSRALRPGWFARWAG